MVMVAGGRGLTEEVDQRADYEEGGPADVEPAVASGQRPAHQIANEQLGPAAHNQPSEGNELPGIEVGGAIQLGKVHRK